MIKKINLGCGPDIRNGWINTDQFKHKGVDAIFDLNKTPSFLKAFFPAFELKVVLRKK